MVNYNTYETNSRSLEVIRLLADYDVILFMRNKPNKVDYVSNMSQNEIINLIGSMIKKKIISEIKKAKYFTLMLDFTPDVSREDQIAEILRYVYINTDKDVQIKEVFLGFFLKFLRKTPQA